MITEGFAFTDTSAAETIGLIEGLERTFALDSLDRQRLVRACFADVAPLAVDPGDLLLYSDEQYQTPGFPFARFDRDVEIDWLWGVRLTDQRPVLVPADLVGRRASQPIVQATSNGAACHGSLHHAVLNGLYEVIERDALMIAWLNRWSSPRLTFTDADLDPCGVRAAFARLSFRLTHVDLTTEVGVPVVLAVLEDQHDSHFFMATMVAGLSPSKVLEKLYRELTQFTYPHLVDPATYRTSVSRSPDPTLVRSLPDHLAFYQHDTKRALTAFLTASDEMHPFAARGEHADWSVAEEIQEAVRRLGAAGYSPVVVDCTAPALEELGLWAVKVVIPGLQPLSVGHGHVPPPKRARPGVAHALNPWPHPFW